MNWTRTTGPTLQSLDLMDVRVQCRIPDDLTADDARLAALVPAATDAFERYANRGLLTQSITLTRDDWFDVLYLPQAAPLQSITSVKYRAADGTLTTLSSSYYLTDTNSEPGRLLRAPNITWPALQADRLAPRVEVVYVVGYTSAADIPDAIKQGQLALIEGLYWGDEAKGRSLAESLWAPYRVWMRPAVCA